MLLQLGEAVVLGAVSTLIATVFFLPLFLKHILSL